MNTPKAGDKMYDCFNGSLTVVTFIKEEIAEGASVPTYVLKDKDGRKFSCAREMYVKTEIEAYERYLQQAEQYGVPAIRKHIQDTIDSLILVSNDIYRVKVALAEAKEKVF